MYPGLLLVDLKQNVFMVIVKITNNTITLKMSSEFDVSMETFLTSFNKGVIQPAQPLHFMYINNKITERDFQMCLI